MYDLTRGPKLVVVILIHYLHLQRTNYLGKLNSYLLNLGICTESSDLLSFA